MKNLNQILDELPDELIERHGLEDLPFEKAFEKAKNLLEKREKLGYKPILGYHTSDRLYQVGEKINPQDSKGLYKGKLFFSKDTESLFRGDNPKYCYKIQVCGAHNDPEDLTGKDWFYTLSPAKVIKNLDEW